MCIGAKYKEGARAYLTGQTPRKLHFMMGNDQVSDHWVCYGHTENSFPRKE
jgi:hypothetical protein